MTGGRGHPVLFANRAAAYMKRKWDGDVYAALRDCLAALTLDRGHTKAHLRVVRCLLELQWLEEAHTALQRFQIRFPDHATASACLSLYKEIAEALEATSSTSATAPGSEGGRGGPPPSLLEDDLNSSSFDEDDDDDDEME